MVDVVYRFGETDPGGPARPTTAREALRQLEEGNDRFASLFEPGIAGEAPRVVSVPAGRMSEGGLTGSGPEEALRHEPFAAVLGCADARVPIELIFGRAINDLFVLRVAGNVLGSEVIGSLDYAIQHLPTVRAIVVLGHTSCGAVTAAADAYLDPASYLGLSAEHQLRSIVDQLFPAVRLAHSVLLRSVGDDASEAPGFAAALVATTVPVNAAIMASSLRSELASYGFDEIEPAFGVYDLVSHRVGVPATDDTGAARTGLFAPPSDAQGFRDLAMAVVEGPVVRSLLEGAPAP